LKHLNKLLLLFILTEELQKQLVEQVELRKKLEREFQNLKGRLFYVNFLSYVFFPKHIQGYQKKNEIIDQLP